MQLFNGIFFLRDLQAIVPDLPRFALVVLGITGAACVLIFFRMSTLARTLSAISRGDAVPLDRRLGARRVLTEIPRLIVTVNIVGFVAGPIISIGLTALLAGKPIVLVDTLLYVALNVSIGLMAALQEITLIDYQMVRPREALGIVEFSDSHGEIDLRIRLLLVALGSTLLTGILIAMAGLGFYHELLRWFASRSADAGSLVTLLAGSSVQTNNWRFLGQMGILILVVASWALLLMATLAYGLLAQIESLKKRMQSIASGDADLSQRVAIVQFDEIGRLTDAINSVISRLQGLVVNVRDAARGISSSSISLVGSTEDARRSVEEISRSLERVHAAVENQNGTVDSSKGSISRLSASIANISEQVTTQASYVEESSAAITEIAANIASVSKLAEQANGITRSLNEVAAKGDSDVREMEKSMEEITRASSAVSDTVSVISRIASQTNLLAMNAAIEAAHAGEAGRGFAVVADEVRGLAETSAQSAKQVMTVIRQMRTKIQTGTVLSEQVKDAFRNITKGIGSAAGLIETITHSMSEQKAGAEEVLKSVGSLIEATEKIKASAGEQTESSRDMEAGMSRIVEAARQIDGALREQVKGVESLAQLVMQADADANENRRRMEELEGAVGGFSLAKGESSGRLRA